MVARRSACLTVPRLGVIPPSIRLAHSSARSAPPCWAASSPSMPSTQISTKGTPGRIGAVSAGLELHPVAALELEDLARLVGRRDLQRQRLQHVADLLHLVG